MTIQPHEEALAKNELNVIFEPLFWLFTDSMVYFSIH